MNSCILLAAVRTIESKDLVFIVSTDDCHLLLILSFISTFQLSFMTSDVSILHIQIKKAIHTLIWTHNSISANDEIQSPKEKRKKYRFDSIIAVLELKKKNFIQMPAK